MSLVESARAVIEQAPVCDPCLGRCFADRSHGLTNAERGRALRVTAAMATDEPFEPPDGPCWVCEGESDRVDAWADRAIDALADIEFATYQVGTKVPPLIEENDRLLREEAGLDPDAGEPFKRELNREVGKRIGAAYDADVDFERADVVVLLDLGADAVDVRSNPAFVYGRYRKLERGLPQTEWPCRECDGTGDRDGVACTHCGGSGYMYEESVEGLVAPHVREAMGGTDATFHGAGREDVDARMLGTGRPFVVEVADPRARFPDVDALETRINDAAAPEVEVTDLALATHDMVERVKGLAASKTYRAEVVFDGRVTAADLEAAVAELDGRTVEQDTPDRVRHRRAEKTRRRTVYHIEAALEDERHATVELRGEGGLYVKELISGDQGRTRPSLAGLVGVEARVTALDVLAVEAEDDAAFADPDYLRAAPESP